MTETMINGQKFEVDPACGLPFFSMIEGFEDDEGGVEWAIPTGCKLYKTEILEPDPELKLKFYESLVKVFFGTPEQVDNLKNGHLHLHAHKRTLDGENIAKFVLAGNATFTLENPETGNRFTFKIRQRENDDGSLTPHFVSVLNGPDNYSNYGYIGFVRNGNFYHGGQKAKASKDAPSVQAFSWFWRHLADPSPAVIYHEGRCGKCGRKLTVPTSIKTGLGPTCAQSTH